MENCPFNISALRPCSISPSYIRPDQGVAFFPWLYSLVLLIVHLPLIPARIFKWEAAIVWSLAMAIFSLVVVSIAYASTQWKPEEIYVWLPISLVIDIGAVMQIFVLVIEEEDRPAVEKDGRRILRFISHYLFWNWMPPAENTNLPEEHELHPHEVEPQHTSWLIAGRRCTGSTQWTRWKGSSGCRGSRARSPL